MDVTAFFFFLPIFLERGGGFECTKEPQECRLACSMQGALGSKSVSGEIGKLLC